MSRGLSVYLDLLRFLAALMVFVLHASFERFSGGLPLLWRLSVFGNDAVMLFFVLSGFVIAHVAGRECEHPGRFAAARLARLWSVCIPALALTLLADGVGMQLAPGLYDFPLYAHSQPVPRLAASLLFLNELWFWSFTPFSNTPYWSIGYEAWYYVLFGAWLFTHGRGRWIAATAIVLVMGPRILLLLPVWLAGVWAYRTRCGQALGPLAAAGLCLSTLAAYLGWRYSALPQWLDAATVRWLGADAVARLGWSSRFLSNYWVGTLVALHFVGARRLLRAHTAVPPRLERAVRHLAGYTFALYLLHNPLLQFFGALALWLGIWDHRALPVVLGPLGVVWLLGGRIERLKTPLRRWLERVFAARGDTGRWAIARPSYGTGVPSAQHGCSTKGANMATNQPKDTERAGYLGDQADDGARTGIQAERGWPQAEHGQYGLVREKSPQAEGLTERQVRGVEATPDRPDDPQPESTLRPQPGHVAKPQPPLPGHTPTMPEPTPPQSRPHPGP